MNFKNQKRILLIGTILTLILTSAVFTFFIHKNHESNRISLIEEKLKGDAKSILPHLYQSGNFAWFNDNLENNKNLLPCLSVSGIDGSLIWGKGKCSSKIEAKNYIDQKVFDIHYTLPETTLLSTIEDNWKYFSIFFFIQVIFLILAYKILSSINKSHSKTLVQIEHINGINNANERILRITRTLGHNLKSPLAALKSFHELTRDRLTPDETDILQTIQSNIDTMTERLIEQKVESTPVSTADISKGISNLIAVKKLEYSKNSQIRIESDIEQGLMAILNRDELKTILSNLINNSIEAKKTEASLTISVLARKLHNKAIIRVKDDGRGISQELISKVFDYGVTSKTQGKGCGLAHAKETIISWSGEISINSLEEQFTEVTITLPLVTTATIKEIILIDDQPMNIKYWKGMANVKKIPFKGYTNSADFFANLPENKTEVAIYVDYELGSENGLDVIKRLVSLGYQNVTLATGHSEHIHPQIAQTGKEFPFSNYVGVKS
jgi:signal transduction histidine kinase